MESAAAQIAAAQGAGLTALARANEISRTAVLRLLDVGAQVWWSPAWRPWRKSGSWSGMPSSRLWGTGASHRDGGWGHAAHAVSISGYMETSNRETLLLPQCETVGCLEHIEEITAMDGVDGIFVGPFDLSIALGHPGEFNAPVVHDAILRVQAACKRSGKLSIIFTGSAAASRQRFAEGFDSVTMGMDSLFYVEMYKNLVADVWGK
ncbi:MAG: aldolase/citrate lyase family protein [Dysosmobacter welbionis]